MNMNTNINSNIENKLDIKNYIKFINQTQENIVMDKSRIIVINGCAGSRKTDTLIKKGINYILSDKKNILFLTFVSSVSNEIKNRIEQSLNVQIPKIGSSNHFLCDLGSNYIEIANIDAWIHKQITWIETNIIPEPKFKTNSSDFDNYIKNKIDEYKVKRDSINFNSRVLLLKNYTDIYKFYNVVLKNGKFTDVILIDEFQDTDMEKVELIIMLVKNNPNLFCVVAGDILQTIFVNNIGCKNFINPINYFKNKLETKYYEINTCFRCPAAHINFVNYLLGEKYKKYGLDLVVSQNNNLTNKPVLFGHDCISKNDTSFKLAQSIGNTIIKIIKLDKEINPSDIVIIMKKSNSNFVYEHIKNLLPKLYKKNNIGFDKKLDSYLIHFETSGDGYSNSINWDKAENKTVLLSIHGDKGKGHKVVFFLGLSKKSIPTDYNIGRDFELVDISLLNVALTRSLKYLFVGFTLVSPSVYLSSKHLELDNYCYLAWKKNIQSELNKCGLNVYSETIGELNKYWFDNLKPSLKVPNFNTNQCLENYYKLPIKLNLNVSQDISKDLVGFVDQIIYDLEIEEDCVDYYEPINITEIPDIFYRIFGFIGELLLERNNMRETKNFGIFNWILSSNIHHTNSDLILNCIYDYKLNHYINDLSLWKDKVIEIEFETIIHKTDFDNRDLISFLEHLELENKPKFIINDFYSKYDIKQIILDFCSPCSDLEFCLSSNTNNSNKDKKIDVSKIIFIALIYADINCEIRRDFIYSIVESIIYYPSIDKIISQIISNVQYVWDNLIKSTNKHNDDLCIEFQKNISIEKKIKNKNILKYYGFNHSGDKNVFKNGLKFGIKGICDLVTTNNTNNEIKLFELKTCLKTSFSNEWVLQIVIYNILFTMVEKLPIKSNWIINLFDGSIYKISYNVNQSILKNILKLYDYDDFLSNTLLS